MTGIWYPVSMAPRDGTPVILWTDDHETPPVLPVTVGYWIANPRTGLATGASSVTRAVGNPTSTSMFVTGSRFYGITPPTSSFLSGRRSPIRSDEGHETVRHWSDARAKNHNGAIPRRRLLLECVREDPPALSRDRGEDRLAGRGPRHSGRRLGARVTWTFWSSRCPPAEGTLAASRTRRQSRPRISYNAQYETGFRGTRCQVCLAE